MSTLESGLVSIVTPAYNAARYLETTIDSVIAQRYTKWEMLIVDDCSYDETPKIIQRYAATDSRVRFLQNEVNSGPAETRNHAIRHATGQYVAFLDSDDLWLPEKLERQLSYMQQHDHAFTFTAFRRISDDGAQTGRRVDVPQSIDYQGLLKNTVIATSTVVVDRSAVGDFKMTRTYYDDFVLWLEILKRGFVAHGFNEDLMRYRVVGGSVSRNKVRSSYKVWRTYRDIENMGLLSSSWAFINYARNAFVKYRRF